MIDRALFALEGIRGALAALVALPWPGHCSWWKNGHGRCKAPSCIWEGAPRCPMPGSAHRLFFPLLRRRPAVALRAGLYLDRYAFPHASTHAPLRRELQAVFSQKCAHRAAQGTQTASLRWCWRHRPGGTYLHASSCRRSCAWSLVPLIVLLCVFPVDWVSRFHHAGHVPSHRVLWG